MSKFNTPRFSSRQEADPDPTIVAETVFPPVADFSVSKPGGNVAVFTDLSTDIDGTIKKWRWSFGDAPIRPVAQFSAIPNGLTVTVTDLSTVTSPATLVSWSWQWGDGTSSSGQVAQHTYAAGGRYDITLTVTDSNGNSSTNTARVSLTLGAVGLPFGPYSGWDGITSLKPYMEYFAWDYGSISPSTIIDRLAAATRLGRKLTFTLMGGSHDQYKTNGVFDRSKWNAKAQLYNTTAIRNAVATAVANGTLLWNNIMDEPANTAPDNSWGPEGTLSKAKVDDMAQYVKNIFPTLPQGVTLDWRIWTNYSFNVIDIQLSQYRLAKGEVNWYRDGALTLGARDKHQIAFSLNVLDGGIKSAAGTWNCPLTTTGGRGTYAPNCRMTPQQVLDLGTALGPYGVALAMWDYRTDMFSDPDYQESFAALRELMDAQPTKSYRRYG